MRRVWPWVVMAPLGGPVVPEVNTRSERSPGVIEAVRPAATSAEHTPPSEEDLPVDDRVARPVGHRAPDVARCRRRGLPRPRFLDTVGTEHDDPLEVGHPLAGGHRLLEQRG